MKNKVFAILRLLPATLYLLFYVPIWNGKHISLSWNSRNILESLFAIFVFAFTAGLFLLAIAGTLPMFTKLPDKFKFLKKLSYIPVVSAIFAAPFLLVFLYYFIFK